MELALASLAAKAMAAAALTLLLLPLYWKLFKKKSFGRSVGFFHPFAYSMDITFLVR